MANRAIPLKKSSSFGELARNSKKIRAAPWLVLHLLPSKDAKNYFGITVSRKVAGAVVRNKLKRWVRNCVRSEPWPEKYVGFQVVFVFRPQAKQAFFSELKYPEFRESLSVFFGERHR